MGSSGKSSRGGAFAIIFLFAFFGGVIGLYIVHTRVIPIPLAVKVFSSYDPDRGVWRQRIRDTQTGDVSKEHFGWSKNSGIGRRNSRRLQLDLWNNWKYYMAFGGSAVFGFLFLLFVMIMVRGGSTSRSRRHRGRRSGRRRRSSSSSRRSSSRRSSAGRSSSGRSGGGRSRSPVARSSSRNHRVQPRM